MMIHEGQTIHVINAIRPNRIATASNSGKGAGKTCRCTAIRRLADKKIVGEAWYDASPNQHDQADRGGNADPYPIIRRTKRRRFDMERDVAGDQNDQHSENAEVSPIASGDDLAQSDHRQSDQESDIDERRQ